RRRRVEAAEKAEAKRAEQKRSAMNTAVDEEDGDDDDAGEDGDMNVFDQFHRSQAQNADEILANFKMRMGALRK
ncbi:unnamed protein product, partial [Symbiodinium microadriaticum]